MSQYIIPHIVSVYSDNIDHDNKDKIKMTIVLDTSEYIGHKNDIKEIIRKRVHLFEHRRTIYGYIIKIYDILDISMGKLIENAKISYDVIVLCKIIDIKAGSIIVGAELLSITDIGFEFVYNDINIIVEYTNVDKKNFIIGSLHNIFVKNKVNTLDSPNYTIKYIVKQGDYNRRQTMYAKKITTPNSIYNKWINKKTYELGDNLEGYDYSGESITIPANNLIDIIKHHQIYTNGILYTKYIFHQDLLRTYYNTYNTSTPILSIKYSSSNNTNSFKYISDLHKHVKSVMYMKDLDYVNRWKSKIIPYINPSNTNNSVIDSIYNIFEIDNKDVLVYKDSSKLIKDMYSKTDHKNIYIDIDSLLISSIGAFIISDICIIKTTMTNLDSDIILQMLYLYGSMFNYVYIYRHTDTPYDSEDVYIIYQSKKNNEENISEHMKIVENILNGKFVSNLIESDVPILFSTTMSNTINMIKHYDFQVHLYGYELLNRYK